MNLELRKDIVETLTRDHKAVVRGPYLNKIECPSCHKREAFTSTDKPWVVKCGRSNKCGESHHVKDLFPELFETWTERYEPKSETERTQNPTAVADGYLRDGRGFDLMSVRGWYTQESYYDREINAGTTTVRFKLPNGFWERLLDKPQRFGKQKARIVGDYKGLAWVPPIHTLDDLAEQREIWITEGIFDAIAMHHAGICAVSSLSSSNYVGEFLKQLADTCFRLKKPKPRIIFAYDPDKAGRLATLKFRYRAEEAGWTVGAAQPPAGGYDWNDLHQLERMADKDVEKYLYYGELLLARSAVEKALLIYHQRERGEFWFTYDAKIWWWKLDHEAIEREERSFEKRNGENPITEADREQILKNSCVVTCICTALPVPLYYQANHVTDESWYYFSIELPADGSTLKKAFTAKQLTSAGEFKNRLLAIAQNAWWTGSGKQLDRIMQDQMMNIKTVQTIDFIGYSKEHNAYILNDVAIKEGRVSKQNEQDYFQFGKLSVKSLSNSPELSINTNLDEYDRSWAHQVHTAFGPAGVVFTAFWLGTLFAEQIRTQHKSYPFYEFVGQAGAGKSTLIEFAWKLCGRRDYEGFDPSKSTIAARSRSFSQVANLPVVLIESDRDQDKAKQKQFDWDELKTAFNGRAIRSMGVKNTGNDTYEPPFRGAVVISQNAPVEAGEAILSRLLSDIVTRERHNTTTKVAAEWLERVPMEHVSGFFITAAQKEKPLMELFNRNSSFYEHHLLKMDEIRMVRIAKCHGQVMALIDCLGKDGLQLLPDDLLTEAKEHCINMATQRQNAINSDHALVVEFWEAVDYIENTTGKVLLNHYGEGNKHIAINLKEFERWCGEFKLRTTEIRILRQHLRASKSRKFVDANVAVRSQINEGKTVKCWIFEDVKRPSHATH